MVKRRLGELRVEKRLRPADTNVVVRANVIKKNFEANMTFDGVEEGKGQRKLDVFYLCKGLGVGSDWPVLGSRVECVLKRAEGDERGS